MSPVSAAVHNNATWCDAVCRAHGCDTAWADGLWVNRSPSPQYYPNVVTLEPSDPARKLGILRSMLGGPLRRPWSVKDAFHRLDLTPLGLEVLFEADWIGLAATDSKPAEPSGMSWAEARAPGELTAWERFWRGADPDAETVSGASTFHPSLLGDADIRFLSLRRAGAVVAVAIANRSDDGSGPVVGMSNVVLGGDDPERYRPGILAAVRGAFPGLPVVGYERGDDLSAMRALGFESLERLTVWLIPA